MKKFGVKVSLPSNEHGHLKKHVIEVLTGPAAVVSAVCRNPTFCRPLYPLAGHSHVLRAVRRLFQAVPADEVVVNLSILDAGVWRPPTGYDLPHGHPEGPLRQSRGKRKGVTALPEPGRAPGASTSWGSGASHKAAEAQSADLAGPLRTLQVHPHSSLRHVPYHRASLCHLLTTSLCTVYRLSARLSRASHLTGNLEAQP